MIYACNAVLDALTSILGITEVDDTASYALCILLARRNELLTDEELDDLTDMFEFRDLCATRIEVDTPEDETLSAWKSLLFSILAKMYMEAI